MNKPKYATVPIDAAVTLNGSLTPGKIYEIRHLSFKSLDYGCGFWVKDDVNRNTFCLERCCGHLQNGNWILSEEDNHHRRDDISTKKLKAVSVLLFVLIVSVCLFGG